MNENEPLNQVSKVTKVMSKPVAGRTAGTDCGVNVLNGHKASGIEAA